MFDTNSTSYYVTGITDSPGGAGIGEGGGARLMSNWVVTIFVLMNSLIVLLAIAGNFLVVYVVYTFKRMRTVTNYFIVNLALSDILMAVFCIPPNTVANLMLQYDDWPFYHWICPMLMYIQTIAVFTSAFTLVTISLDRYLAIIYPLRQRTTWRQAVAAIVTVWVASCLVSLPVVINSLIVEGRSPENKPRLQCIEEWPSMERRRAYTFAVLGLQYALPLLVLAFTYTRIAVVIWVKKAPGEANGSRDQKMAASKRKMVKMMIIVVVFYCLCWLPIHLINIIGESSRGAIYAWRHIQTVYMVCQWLAMSNSCVNPFVYCWMNGRYRAGFRAAGVSIAPCLFRDSAGGDETRNGLAGAYSLGSRAHSTAFTTTASLCPSPSGDVHQSAKLIDHRGM